MPILKNLKTYRTFIGENQETFAKLLGCTKSNYSNKESGKTPITLNEAHIITQYLSEKLQRDITIDEVFFKKMTL